MKTYVVIFVSFWFLVYGLLLTCLWSCDLLLTCCGLYCLHCVLINIGLYDSISITWQFSYLHITLSDPCIHIEKNDIDWGFWFTSKKYRLNIDFSRYESYQTDSYRFQWTPVGFTSNWFTLKWGILIHMDMIHMDFAWSPNLPCPMGPVDKGLSGHVS